MRTHGHSGFASALALALLGAAGQVTKADIVLTYNDTTDSPSLTVNATGLPSGVSVGTPTTLNSTLAESTTIVITGLLTGRNVFSPLQAYGLDEPGNTVPNRYSDLVGFQYTKSLVPPLLNINTLTITFFSDPSGSPETLLNPTIYTVYGHTAETGAVQTITLPSGLTTRTPLTVRIQSDLDAGISSIAPEPSTLATTLFGVGLAVGGGWWRRRKVAASAA